MKQKLITLLAATAIVLTLTACSANSENTAGEDDVITHVDFAPLTIWFDRNDDYSTYRSEIVDTIALLQDTARSGNFESLESRESGRDITNPSLAEDSGVLELTEFYYPNVEIDGLRLRTVTIQRGGFNFDYTSADSDLFVQNQLTITIISADTDCPYLVLPPDASIEQVAARYGEAYSNMVVRDDLIFIESYGFNMLIGLLGNTRFYITAFDSDFDTLHTLARDIAANAELVTVR